MKPGAGAAVIGGGYAGLAAAVELAHAGIPVTLFESAKALGGRARRVDSRGMALDNGQHLLLGAYRELLRLMHRVGAEDGALLRLPLQLEFPGHFSLRAPQLPAPFHLLYALLNAKGLSVGERLSAARFMLALRRDGFRLHADLPVAALLERHRQGGALRRYLWEPLCLAALNTPLEDASAQVFLNVLRDSFNRRRADSDMLLPRVDAARLFPEPAARYVERQGGEVRLGLAVRGIARREGGYVVTTDAGTRHFSHVVCAVPPQRLAGLTGKLPELAAITELAGRFRYQPIYSLYLRYPESVALSAPLLGLTDSLAQWVFDLGQLGRGKGLLCVVISAAGVHEALPRDELARRIHDELCRAFGALPAPLWTQIIAEKRATFTCAAGLQRPPNRTPLADFYLAGDYTTGDYPATLEGAVRSGVEVARIIADSQK